MQSWDICYETKSCLTEARVTTRVAEIPACKFFALSSDLGLLSPDKDKSHRRHPMRPLSKRCRRESCMKGCGVGASSYQKRLRDSALPLCATSMLQPPRASSVHAGTSIHCERRQHVFSRRDLTQARRIPATSHPCQGRRTAVVPGRLPGRASAAGARVPAGAAEERENLACRRRSRPGRRFAIASPGPPGWPEVEDADGLDALMKLDGLGPRLLGSAFSSLREGLVMRKETGEMTITVRVIRGPFLKNRPSLTTARHLHRLAAQTPAQL